MNELLPYVDLLIANEADCHHLLGTPLPEGKRKPAENSADLDHGRYRSLSEKLFTHFPNLKYHALTLRESYSANHNGWSAYLFNGSQLFASRSYDITAIVDRVGGGDSFAAGLIYGLHTGLADADALEYAAAASCLKHSIAGDVNLATVAEVERLLVEDSSGRVRR